MRSRVRFPAEPHFLPFCFVSSLNVIYVFTPYNILILKAIYYSLWGGVVGAEGPE